jgi:hypothetical protein
MYGASGLGGRPLRQAVVLSKRGLMLHTIDEFFRGSEHTIAALSAISTFAAVVVSLAIAFFAHRANRTRLKAAASIKFIFHETATQPYPEYLYVNLTNIGILPATVQFSFFYWRLPFARGLMLISPLEFYGDNWHPKRAFPVEIGPRRSVSICLSSIHMLRKTLGELSASGLLNHIRLRFMKAYVATDDNKTFKVKLDRSVRKEIRLAASERSKK